MLTSKSRFVIIFIITLWIKKQKNTKKKNSYYPFLSIFSKSKNYNYGRRLTRQCLSCVHFRHWNGRDWYISVLIISMYVVCRGPFERKTKLYYINSLISRFSFCFLFQEKELHELYKKQRLASDPTAWLPARLLLFDVTTSDR